MHTYVPAHTHTHTRTHTHTHTQTHTHTGTDFIDKLIHQVQQQQKGDTGEGGEARSAHLAQGAGLDDASQHSEVTEQLDDNAPITCKEFIIAFARCLGYGVQDGVAEVLETRASEYRRIGKLFGMEKVQPTFQWAKFWLSFLATGLAFLTLPIAGILHRLRGGGAADDTHIVAEAGGWQRGHGSRTLYNILRTSQWLPHPFTTFDALQQYLMAQWLPCICALALYVMFQVCVCVRACECMFGGVGVDVCVWMYYVFCSVANAPTLAFCVLVGSCFLIFRIMWNTCL